MAGFPNGLGIEANAPLADMMEKAMGEMVRKVMNDVITDRLGPMIEAFDSIKPMLPKKK